jgi:hypothetical protein
VVGVVGVVAHGFAAALKAHTIAIVFDVVEPITPVRDDLCGKINAIRMPGR